VLYEINNYSTIDESLRVEENVNHYGKLTVKLLAHEKRCELNGKLWKKHSSLEFVSSTSLHFL